MIFRRRPLLTDYRMPDDVLPVCPKCDENTDGLMSREITSPVGRANVWCCPRCHAILGVTHQRDMASVDLAAQITRQLRAERDSRPRSAAATTRALDAGLSAKGLLATSIR